jgi:antitoxin component YwqK of YwqJK toxin-antitoxin module
MINRTKKPFNWAICRLILCIILLKACHSKQHILLEKYSNGSIKRVRDYSDNNVYYEREYFESGDLREVKKFKDGLQDSIQTEFDESGNMRAQIYFKNGLRNGVTREIYDNGQILFEGNCINGKFEGLVAWYYPNGKIKEQIHRHLDKDTGSWVRYDTAGNLLKTAER